MTRVINLQPAGIVNIKNMFNIFIAFTEFDSPKKTYTPTKDK